jgi:AcrR family transcriptional regulator
LRGDALRQHILYAAKSVFLEIGFERASMDLIAAAAETSKRTLYAHFESKEKLYLAVIDLARQMYALRIKLPGEYADEPLEALTLFGGRILALMLHKWTIRMIRLSISESERFPQGAAAYFESIFGETQRRLAAYLKATFALTPKASSDAADRLLGQFLYPLLPRTLLGLEPLREDVTDTQDTAVDLKPVRKIVRAFIDSLE